MEIISAIFKAEVINAGFGKLDCIDLNFLTADYLFGIPPKRGTTNRRLAWILKEYRITC
jgi:hypothetical protein